MPIGRFSLSLGSQQPLIQRHLSMREVYPNALVGAIDEGTSSARFIVFKAGSTEVVASHQEKLSQTYPKEGWVEQDPLEILQVVEKCIEETVKKLENQNYSAKDIIAVGVTNQRESTIVWDPETGDPLHNSIVWLDMRTASTVDQLLDTVPNKTRNKNYLKPLCGLPMSPYFSAVKLRWLYDNVAKVKRAMNDGRCLFGTVDTWIIWNLTGGKDGGLHITDVSNASRTMLMNIESLKWDPTLIKFFGVPSSVLPTIKSSSEVYGPIVGGPLDGISLAGCLGDQQAALVGQQCLNRGQAKATYGTGCFLLYNTGNSRVLSSHGLITTVAYQLGPEAMPVYALEGSVAVAGAALGWLRDNLQLIQDVNQVQQIAEIAGDAESDVYFVPAFSGLYAPYWQQDARGVICGLTEDTDSSHIVRATLEAVSFQVRDILDAMEKDCDSGKLSELQVDGGMTANPLLMQLQADLAGVNVVRPAMAESTALGAAIVAGAAVGVWDPVAPLDIPHTRFTPRFTDNQRDMRYSKWKMAVERAVGWEI